MIEGFMLDVNHKPVIHAGLMEDQAGSLIKAFFKEKR
jgi:hypothetical protein